MNRLRVVVTDKEEINNNSFKSTIPGNMSGKTGFTSMPDEVFDEELATACYIYII